MQVRSRSTTRARLWSLMLAASDLDSHLLHGDTYDYGTARLHHGAMRHASRRRPVEPGRDAIGGHRWLSPPIGLTDATDATLQAAAQFAIWDIAYCVTLDAHRGAHPWHRPSPPTSRLTSAAAFADYTADTAMRLRSFTTACAGCWRIVPDIGVRLSGRSRAFDLGYDAGRLRLARPRRLEEARRASRNLSGTPYRFDRP